MKRYGVTKFIVIVAAVVMATVFIYCRSWKNKSPEERAEWITKRITKELDLNDSQKATLTRIKEEILARQKAEKSDRDAQFAELTALIRGESIDKARLSDLKKRHIALRSSTEDLFVEKAIEFHKVLTPEQRVKAADALAKHGKRFSGEK